MSDYKAGNLRGTLKDDFEIGDGAEHGIDRVGENLRLRDQELSLAQRISDLMGWERVKSGQTRTIETDFTHTTTKVVIESGGTLVIESGGTLAII